VVARSNSTAVTTSSTDIEYTSATRRGSSLDPTSSAKISVRTPTVGTVGSPKPDIDTRAALPDDRGVLLALTLIAIDPSPKTVRPQAQKPRGLAHAIDRAVQQRHRIEPHPDSVPRPPSAKGPAAPIAPTQI
jgi:hypothetical protein